MLAGLLLDAGTCVNRMDSYSPKKNLYILCSRELLVIRVVNPHRTQLNDALIAFCAAFCRVGEVINSLWPRSPSGLGFAQCQTARMKVSG